VHSPSFGYFFTASTVQHYQANTRQLHLSNSEKKTPNHSVTTTGNAVLIWKERGRVACTWRKTDIHPCGNPEKHSQLLEKQQHSG